MQCPAEEKLKSFLLGDLPGKETEVISVHVDGCEVCEEVLLRLERTPDPFFSAVQSLVQLGNQTDEAGGFDQVRQRLIDLHSSRASSVSAESDRFGNASGALQSDARQRIGRYELVELIGRGGMGAVYKARHLKLKRSVAIKLLPDRMLQSTGAVARFEREMEAVGALHHPNIVHATDAAEVDGTHFIVMELVDGMDVSSLVKSVGTLSIADSCEIIRQAALGLQHAHEQGLVHRDVKPSNLLLSSDGIVKLLDLGLARISSEQADELTSTSQIMGTIDYMAPEQADSSRTADYRADLYSLGATCFRLLTGVAPLDAHGCSTKIQKLTALLHHDYPDASQLRADLPEELLSLLRQLLSRTPDDRPRSANDVAQALLLFCEGHSLAQLIADVKSGDVSSVADQANIETSKASLQTLADEGDAELPETVKRASTTRTRSRKGLLATTLFAIVIALGLIIRVATDNGQVVVELADSIREQVTVNILRDGEPAVEGWTVTSEDASRKVRTGRIEVEIEGELGEELEISFRGGNAELSRNGEVVVSVARRKQTRPPQVTGDSSESEEASLMTRFADQLRFPGSTDDILQGILPAPATLPSIGRWQIESVAPRGQITDLRYSPDGNWFAVASGDKVVRIYRVTENGLSFHAALSDGRHSLQLRWHPESQLLAIATFMGERSSSPTISIWDVEKSVLRRQITADCQLSSIDWAPDGNHLVAAGAFVKRVLCWSVSGELEWRRDNVGADTVRWNPIKPLIAVSVLNEVKLLDAATGELHHEFPIHRSHVGGIEWSPTGRFLATGSRGWNQPDGDTALRVWSAGGVELAKVAVSGSNVSHVAWSRDENLLAAGADMVRVWHFKSDPSGENATLTDIKPPQPFPHHIHRNICGLDWSTHGQLASADIYDGPRVWPSTWGLSGLRLQNYGQLTALEWSPIDNRFVTYNNRGAIREWTSDGRFHQSFRLGSGALPVYDRSDVAWSPDGELLAVTDGDGRSSYVYETKFSAEQRPQVVTVPEGVAAHLSWSHDSQLLAIAPWIHSSQVYLWDRHVKAVRKIGDDVDSRVEWAGWSPSQDRIFIVADRGAITSLDRITGARTSHFTPELSQSKDEWGEVITGIAAPAAIDRIALGCRWRFSACLDLSSDAKELWRRADITMPLSWSPLAQQIVARHSDHTLEVLDARNGETLYSLGSAHGIEASWSADGQHIASFPAGGKYSDDTLNLVHVWKTDASQQVMPEFVGVMLPDGLAASFAPSGLPISLSEEAEQYLRWVVERPDGSLEFLSRTEFLSREDRPVQESNVLRPHDEVAVDRSVESATVDALQIELDWNPDEFEEAGPEEVAEPPALGEWLIGKEIITVAQDGTGDYKSIYDATRPEVVKPNQVIEVLDKGPYIENLNISGLPQDCGLVSRVGTIIVIAGWKPLPSPDKGYTQQQAHFVSRSPGFRLSGFRFHYDRQPFAMALQFFAFGGGIIENCVFIGTGRNSGSGAYPDEIRLFLRFRGGFAPESGEPMPRFWVRDNVFLSSLRLQSQVEPPVEYRVARNLMIGQDRQYRLNLWAGSPADEGVRFIVEQNVFDCRQNGMGIRFTNEQELTSSTPANGFLAVDRNTFNLIRPGEVLAMNTKVPLNGVSFTRNLLDGNQNAWVGSEFPVPESVAYNVVPVDHASVPIENNLQIRRPLPTSNQANADYMRPDSTSDIGRLVKPFPDLKSIGAVPFHSNDRPPDWLDTLRERLIEQQELQQQIATDHGWKVGKR